MKEAQRVPRLGAGPTIGRRPVAILRWALDLGDSRSSTAAKVKSIVAAIYRFGDAANLFTW